MISPSERLLLVAALLLGLLVVAQGSQLRRQVERLDELESKLRSLA